MRRRTKLKIKKWLHILFWCAVIGLVLWANVNRLRDNLYANYEKIIDYGRVREVKEVINPVMAAIFYDDKVEVKKNITFYFNHSDSYKRQNVKIVIVPKDLISYSKSMVKKLFEEVNKYNQIDSVALVHDDKNSVQEHIKMLKKVLQVEKITEFVLTEDDLTAEKDIDELLAEKNKMVVFLTDLSKGINNEDGEQDFLLQEAVYFAQKYFYHLEVFDVVDTQIARSIEKDYASLFSLNNEEIPPLQKQQHNLMLYKKHYENDILRYFKINLYNSGDAVWPKKSVQNYRLFDRGMIYVRLYDEELKEVFSRKVINDNQGVVVSLINIAHKAARKIKAESVKYIKISLLTEMEEIKKDRDTLLISYLDQDDGVMVSYANRYAFMIADERPDDPVDLEKILINKAGIRSDVSEENIHFYKFKSVEINDEN